MPFCMIYFVISDPPSRSGLDHASLQLDLEDAINLKLVGGDGWIDIFVASHVVTGTPSP